ncbi:hypothetical protein [Acinetobacter lactucae]|uniref:Uncharacterized protein n=1 Tax=Acinetobacter lactucae TaxID=1785128 RepID=R8YVR7_9GAMM|nr:hypothetical protein [Acinetobacter lactucae]EOQ73490.1 hypothetical protein F929_03433 [Acinetobacter lactucae]
MTYSALESETLIECEKIKAKAAIAVAILNHACSGTAGFNGVNDDAKADLIKFITDVQKTIDE